MSAPVWRKSSYSGGASGNCIEVGTTKDTVVVRDTKDHGNGPVLTFGREAWEAFASAIKSRLQRTLPVSLAVNASSLCTSRPVGAGSGVGVVAYLVPELAVMLGTWRSPATLPGRLGCRREPCWPTENSLGRLGPGSMNLRLEPLRQSRSRGSSPP